MERQGKMRPGSHEYYQRTYEIDLEAETLILVSSHLISSRQSNQIKSIRFNSIPLVLGK
jgi:hypothetical protein